MKKIISLIINLFFLSISTYAINYEPEEIINISVYEKINPAIVSIEAETKDGLSSGTGCIVTQDGTILTGSHVVDDAEKIDVTTCNGKVYKAKVIAKMGKSRDLSLIKIESKQPLQTVSFGD